MAPHRLYVKLFLDDPAAVDPADVVPVFHRWIQQQDLGELLIDVHDYKHVPGGPGILLVGHEADYALDGAQGRPGLLYRRKRAQPGSLHDALVLALRQALAAAERFQAEALPGAGAAFRTDEVEVGFLDALRWPNRQEVFTSARHELDALVHVLYGDAAVDVAWVDLDPRRPLALHVHAAEAATLPELRARLAAVAPAHPVRSAA